MKNYFTEIEEKLKKNIQIENLEIVDNSHKHKGHKFFNSYRYHLKLRIKSSYLYTMPRTEAHKLIMKILKHDLEKKIHALEINIEQ